MNRITQFKLSEYNITELNDFRIFIKNYVEKYGIADHLTNSPEFIEEFIKTFGHSNDFFQTHDIVYCYYIRKFIGSDARDYWYDEALHYYDHINYYANINDSYFNDVPFDGPEHYKKVLAWRKKYWKELTEKDELYKKQLSERLNDDDKKFIEHVKNLRVEDLTYSPDDQYDFDDAVVYNDDVVYGNIADFSLDPDHNEKVEERRQRQRQRQNEIDYGIGREQDRLLANYLQKLEDS